MKLVLSGIVLLCLAAATIGRWTRVGDASHVSIDAAEITLSTPEGQVAGGISESFDLKGDAVIVQAKVTRAPARGVTFTVQDAQSGESVAYWQNPLAVSEVDQLDALLPLSVKTAAGRLFVGTDRVASTAKIGEISFKPTTRRVSIRNSAYGALVDTDHAAGQTFEATASTLDAIRFRLRQLNNVSGPDLCVKVFAWDNAGKTGPALAERVIPRRQLPQPTDGFEVDFPVVLNAKLKPGNMYYIEWTAAGPCTAEQALLLYAGDGTYPKGCRYENGNAVQDWDMYVETFESN